MSASIRAGMLVASILLVPACNKTSTQSPASEMSAKKIDASGPEFEEWVKSFVAELRSGDKARQRKAAIAFMPTPDEIRGVFPRSGPKSAEQMQAALERTTEADIDRAVEEFIREFAQPGPIKISHYRDLRKDPEEDPRVKKALEEMQLDVPFIEAGWMTGNVGGGRTYYMRVNGRWVFMDSLKGLIEFE